MAASVASADLIVCCHVPDHATDADVTRWRGQADAVGVAVTWVTSAAGLSRWGDHGAGAWALRIDAGSSQDRCELRRQLAAAATGQITAAVMAGDVPLEHHQLFVDHGIDVVATRRLHAATRQNRRPPPPGWDCRCVFWGLWEVAFTTPRRRWFGLVEDRRTPPGGLTVIETGCRPGETDAAGFARLRVTLGGIRDDASRATIQVAHLADLPALIAGGQRGREPSSILAAA
jgi:hypothetical protein